MLNRSRYLCLSLPFPSTFPVWLSSVSSSLKTVFNHDSSASVGEGGPQTWRRAESVLTGWIVQTEAHSEMNKAHPAVCTVALVRLGRGRGLPAVRRADWWREDRAQAPSSSPLNPLPLACLSTQAAARRREGGASPRACCSHELNLSSAQPPSL